jgi:cytochrome c oxidase assembly factor CtaG
VELDPFQLAPLLLVAAMYATRVRTLARRGRTTSRSKQAWFYSGIALLVVAVASPIHYLGEHRLLYMHMIQHLLIGDLAALALVLGLDGPILRPVLAFPPAKRLRWLGQPLVALPLWLANLCLWHIPGLYQGALAHPALHALQHQLFLLCGVLMWAAVIEPLPGPAWFGAGWRAVYVLAVRTAGAALANVFIWAAHPLYPWYAAGERVEGIAPLGDQTIAGSIMLVEGSVVTLGVFIWLFLQWTREAELGARLVELGHDPARASRAARYGRSAAARGARQAGDPPS